MNPLFLWSSSFPIIKWLLCDSGVLWGKGMLSAHIEGRHHGPGSDKEAIEMGLHGQFRHLWRRLDGSLAMEHMGRGVSKLTRKETGWGW